jgi:hypothetical protein
MASREVFDAAGSVYVVKVRHGQVYMYEDTFG